jgi:DnaJ-class molecular chaperone
MYLFFYDDGTTSRHDDAAVVEREFSPRIDQIIPAREVVFGMTLLYRNRRLKVTSVQHSPGRLLECDTCGGYGWVDNSVADHVRSGDGTCPTCAGWGNVHGEVTYEAPAQAVAGVLRAGEQTIEAALGILTAYTVREQHRADCDCRVCRVIRAIQGEANGEAEG